MNSGTVCRYSAPFSKDLQSKTLEEMQNHVQKLMLTNDKGILDKLIVGGLECSVGEIDEKNQTIKFNIQITIKFKP